MILLIRNLTKSTQISLNLKLVKPHGKVISGLRAKEKKMSVAAARAGDVVEDVAGALVRHLKEANKQIGANAHLAEGE